MFALSDVKLPYWEERSYIMKRPTGVYSTDVFNLIKLKLC